MGISVVVGLLGGRWLDGKAGTAPWLMLAGLLVGVVAGFRGLMRFANEARARAKAEDAKAEHAKAEHAEDGKEKQESPKP